MPRVSIVIVARSRETALTALKSLEQLDPADHEQEILLALGTQPAAQRNAAMRAAGGDYVLFLDNDSEVAPDLLKRYVQAIRLFPDAAAYGGPSVYRQGSLDFRDSVQSLFSSVFAVGPVRSRYRQLGGIRKSNERELILCNLLVRRSVLAAQGGFDERLYPNEENEFLNRVVRDQEHVVYHPGAAVFREPRGSWKAFILQMLRYGQGRYRHISLRPRLSDAIFVLPAGFTAYVVALPVLLAFGGRGGWPLIPAVLHAGLGLCLFAGAVASGAGATVLWRLPFLYFCCHFFYGAGLLSGPFHKRTKAYSKVELIQISSFRASPCTSVSKESGQNFKPLS